MRIVECLDDAGRSPFARWFENLDAAAAAKVTVALAWLEGGALSNVKTVGDGVLECRIDWGPGYRIHFCRRGDTIIVLLGGGDKRRQSRDIETAKARYRLYKASQKR